MNHRLTLKPTSKPNSAPNLQSVLREMSQGRTLVFGHRGASAYAPMNTLFAFEKAAELGADGVELDVQRSRDGHAVIIHDTVVDTTTNGHGRVSDLTLPQIKELDAGYWFGQNFTGTQVPTLDEVFEAVGKKLYVNVEIKSLAFYSDGIEQVIAEKIQRFGMKDRVIVSSFNPMALRRFRKLMPDVPTGYLVRKGVPFYLPILAIGLDYDTHNPSHEMINARYMAKAKKKGHWVETWTVNDPVRAIELRRLGVNMMITDWPDIIRHAIESTEH